MEPSVESGHTPPRPRALRLPLRRRRIEPDPDASLEFSTGEGGPWNGLRRLLGLTRRPRLEVSVLVLAAVGPLLAADIISGRSLTGDAYVRSALALPLLLVAERLVGWATRICSRRVTSDGLVPGAEVARYARVVVHVRQLLEARLPEALFLAAALAVAPMRLEAGPGAFSSFWSEWVTLVIFRFLLLRMLWRWLVWGFFCALLSRVRLVLAANHPDRAGGLSFLRLPSLALMPALTGLSAIVVFGFGTMPGPLAIAAVAVSGLALGLGPPSMLVARLARSHLEGLAAFNRAAVQHGRAFRSRLERAAFLEGAEINASEQTDFNSEVERVARMGVVPYGRDTVLLVGAATLLPFLVQYVFTTGLDVALLNLGRKLLG